MRTNERRWQGGGSLFGTLVLNPLTWDIVSQATIGGQQGLILVEAKAHDSELRNEECGKKLKKGASEDSRENHKRIGECISGASEDLQRSTGIEWALSRDQHYQMSNRLAWAWRVTRFGIPVILIYLGFLEIEDMDDRGCPFASNDDWTKHVKSHSSCAEHRQQTALVQHKPLFTDKVWDRTLTLSGTTLTPIIRSLKIPLVKRDSKASPSG